RRRAARRAASAAGSRLSTRTLWGPPQYPRARPCRGAPRPTPADRPARARWRPWPGPRRNSAGRWRTRARARPRVSRRAEGVLLGGGGCAAQNAAVERAVTVGHALQGQLALDARPAAAAHLARDLRRAQQPHERIGQRARI